LQVFGQPASTDVARVLTCLFEKDLEFELIRIDTFKKEHKLPEFIKLRVRLPAISVHSALCSVNWVQNFSIVAWLCRILPGR
jgi:glutathione S-transferase